MAYNMLYDYQKKIVDELTPLKSNGLITGTGTGKSIMILSLFEQYKLKFGVNKMVIVCIKAKAEEWQEDCAKHFPESKILIANNKVQFDIIDGNFDILIINFAKVIATLYPALICAINEHTYLAVDESHEMINLTSKQSMCLMRLSHATSFKTIATATPIERGFEDWYTQMYFLGIITCNAEQFNYKYLFRNKQGDVIDYRNVGELKAILNHYCRYYKRELPEDLQPEINVVSLPLAAEYEAILRDNIYKDIELDSFWSKKHALKTLCNGTVYHKDKIYKLNSYKLDWVTNFVDKNKEERVIIFYDYNHQRDELADSIKKLGRPVAVYCGVKKEDELYKTEENCVILVQYKSGSTGVDWLKLGRITIFYSISERCIYHTQSLGRTNRFGQNQKPIYYILLSDNKEIDAIDHLTYQKILKRQMFAEQMFE